MAGSPDVTGVSQSGVPADVDAFLARLTRLDPDAVVRVRSAGTSSRLELWGRVPWGVLVTRTVEWSGAGVLDITVSATAWLSAADADPAALPRLDARWRTPLPADGVVAVLEMMPTSVILGISTAAAETLRATALSGFAGRAVGVRAVRDALLDHVPIIVTVEGDEVEVPQRLVQAVARMGFLGEEHQIVQVVRNGLWVGISAAYGIAWWRRQPALLVQPHRG